MTDKYEEYTLDDLIAVVTVLDERIGKTHDSNLTEELGRLLIHMNNIENLGYDIDEVMEILNKVHMDISKIKSKN